MISRDTYRNQWVGKSTDNWVATNPIFKGKIANGDARFDMDTSKAYMWDEDTNTWLQLS